MLWWKSYILKMNLRNNQKNTEVDQLTPQINISHQPATVAWRWGISMPNEKHSNWK